MPKGMLHLSIETNLLETAKNLKYPDGKPFNLSSEFEAFIKIRVEQISGINQDNKDSNALEAERLKAAEELLKPKELDSKVLAEIDNFISDIKGEDGTIKFNWKMFLVARARLIFSRTGIQITPDQLASEVEKRLNNV